MARQNFFFGPLLKSLPITGLDCGILRCNFTWSLQQILLLLAFKWKQAANLAKEPEIQNLSLWHLQNIYSY